MLSFYKRNFVPVIKLEDFIDKALTYDSFLRSFFWYVLIVCVSVFVLYLAAAKGMKNTVMKYTVLILSMACAVSYNRGGSESFTAVENMLSSPASLDFLKNDPDFKDKRVLAPGIMNQMEYAVKTNDPDGFCYYNRESLFPNVPMSGGIANADGFDSLIPGDFFLLKSALNALDAPWDHPAFSLLNVKYISSAPELRGVNIKKKFHGMTNLYEYAHPSGPAYFIPVSTGWPAAGKKEKIGKTELPAISLKFMKNSKDLGIIFSRKNTNVFEAGVNAPEKGTLVISENFFPGWNAYEAGKKLKVFKANVCFMAVSLERGSHRIVFKYEPLVFAVSAWLSLIALGLLVAAGVFKLKAGYEVSKRLE
jgi:hypothetical protein